jgi:hypothetical protein
VLLPWEFSGEQNCFAETEFRSLGAVPRQSDSKNCVVVPHIAAVTWNAFQTHSCDKRTPIWHDKNQILPFNGCGQARMIGCVKMLHSKIGASGMNLPLSPINSTLAMILRSELGMSLSRALLERDTWTCEIIDNTTMAALKPLGIKIIVLKMCAAVVAQKLSAPLTLLRRGMSMF